MTRKEEFERLVEEICESLRAKAGAYALQEEAAIYISGITGDYYTIVGLSVHLVYKHLQEMGY